MVEIPTARRAVEQSGPAELAAVRTALRRMEDAAGEPGSPDYWDIHRDLHWALIAAGANVWTQRMLEPAVAGDRALRAAVRDPLPVS